MKFALIGLILLAVVGGGGAYYYLNILVPPPDTVETAETGDASGEKSDVDLNVEGIKEHKSSKEPAPKPKTAGKPYEEIDYSDSGKRFKAQDRVLEDIKKERDETTGFLDQYDREKNRKKERADAINKWLEKGD